MASVYRLWASLRIRDSMHWKEKWADTALHGYRPGRRAEDVWIDLSLSVESALVDDSDLVGMSIRVNVLTECHRESPSSLLRGKAYTLECCNLCVACTRGEGVSCLKRHHSRLSSECAAAKCLHDHLGQVSESGDHNAMPTVYADDAGVLSKNSEDIDIASKITGRFATVTQQKLNVEKPRLGHH